MPKKKYPNEYDDAKGDTHKEFSDGSCEIYHGGFREDRTYMEITDEADVSVNRRRFMMNPHTATASEQLLTRDDAGKLSDIIKGADEAAAALGVDLDDDAVPGIDGLEPDDPHTDHDADAGVD